MDVYRQEGMGAGCISWLQLHNAGRTWPERFGKRGVLTTSLAGREFTPTMIAQTYKKDVRFISSNFKSMWLIDDSAAMGRQHQGGLCCREGEICPELSGKVYRSEEISPRRRCITTVILLIVYDDEQFIRDLRNFY